MVGKSKLDGAFETSVDTIFGTQFLFRTIGKLFFALHLWQQFWNKSLIWLVVLGIARST